MLNWDTHILIICNKKNCEKCKNKAIFISHNYTINKTILGKSEIAKNAKIRICNIIALPSKLSIIFPTLAVSKSVNLTFFHSCLGPFEFIIRTDNVSKLDFFLFWNPCPICQRIMSALGKTRIKINALEMKYLRKIPKTTKFKKMENTERCLIGQWGYNENKTQENT